MKIERKPFQRRADWKSVDYAALRVDILNYMEDGAKTTDQIIKALLPKWTRHATYQAIRYLRDDKYIVREKSGMPWKRVV